MINVHEQLVLWLGDGERVALATVVRGRGSRPRETGAKMLVRADGTTFASVGGGAMEAAVVAECRSLLEHGGEARTVRVDLTESGEHSVGMTCGGSVEVFVEVVEPARRLFIFGAGHVGRALASAARLLGFATTLVDDRAEWLVPRQLPEGVATHRCAADYGSDLPPVRGEDLVAVMTRCHATDVAVLRHVASARPRYVGLIGSRRKIVTAFRALAEEHGVARDFLDEIRAPIGLDIGASTPGEIAIAVAAELVAVLRRDQGAGHSDPGRSGEAERAEAGEGLLAAGGPARPEASGTS